MKKLALLLLALLLALPLGALGEEILNPEGYGLLYVTDLYITQDSEADENGDYPPAAHELIVQGAFGEVTGEGDETEFIGFDENAVRALGVADDCAFLLAVDLFNPVENVACEDPVAWLANAREYNATFSDEPYGFYATFELDENGELTRLEYAYFPWN